jgi:hypothetical protein
MNRCVVFLSAMLFAATAASAQSLQTPSGQPRTAAFAMSPSLFSQGTATGRRGFTILANIGLGFQKDQGLEDSALGLAGINLGVGGFLNPNLGVMFRFSGTNVTYDFGGFGEVDQVSGVAGPAVQYWVSDKVAVEAGAGLGYWRTPDGDTERGLGLIFGVSTVIFRNRGHNLLAGVEYAPAFTDPGTVHNFGFTFGYQFHR